MTSSSGDTPEPPASSGERALQRLAARLDNQMVVVTALAPDGRRSGCLVGFFTQCSIHPPRILPCISKANHTFAVAEAAPVLAVHFLGDDDGGLAELFGGETGDEVDKFTRCAWRPGPEGVPVLGGVLGWLAGPVLDRFDAGDHVAFLVEPAWGEAGDSDADPLGFQAVRDIDPGHDA